MMAENGQNVLSSPEKDDWSPCKPNVVRNFLKKYLVSFLVDLDVWNGEANRDA